MFLMKVLRLWQFHLERVSFIFINSISIITSKSSDWVKKKKSSCHRPTDAGVKSLASSLGENQTQLKGLYLCFPQAEIYDTRISWRGVLFLTTQVTNYLMHLRQLNLDFK